MHPADGMLPLPAHGPDAFPHPGGGVARRERLARTGRGSLPAAPDGACPMLGRETGHCAIYADRPFGCRTHFCAAAGGPYARREVVDLIYRLEDLSRRIGGTEAQALPTAMPAALALLEQERGRARRARVR